MAGDEKSNGNREFGELHTSIKYMEHTLSRIEGQLQPLTGLVSQNQSRIDSHDTQLTALWQWRDGALARAAMLITTALLAGGALASAVIFLVGLGGRP